ncbi:hypothetical protein HDA40_002417 [Hamadaea flava]|uniref:EccD-like transmembrane domain-containing protein n=1 Tax=Hamadaea flava TaxID=1742688 RepID=A0ABV8LKE4_9ACTN|nr:hypothetical protein [Hamadaea flava]MCP2323910.1 hypothetical protein [Hamadaea flava]
MTEDRLGGTLQPAFALWSAATVLGGAILLPAARVAEWTTIATAGLAVLVALSLAWWGRRRTGSGPVTALLAVAGVWAALAGWLSTVLLDRVPVVAAAAATVCAAGIVTIAGRLLGFGRPLATALLVGAMVAAAVAAWAALGSDVRQPLRVVPVLVVLGVGLLPRFALGAGGMAEASFRLRAAGQAVPPEQVDRSLRVAEEHLIGGITGLAAGAGVCGVVLIGTGDHRDVALALGLALLLWLRSRLFERTGQVLPLRLATAAVVLAGAVRVLLLGWDWALPAALGAVLVLTIAFGSRRVRSTGRGRLLRVGELLVAAATVVVLVAATGLAELADPLARQ